MYAFYYYLFIGGDSQPLRHGRKSLSTKKGVRIVGKSADLEESVHKISLALIEMHTKKSL